MIPQAYAYTSPESYAVNEADIMDYRQITPPPKLDLDALDDDRFQAPNLVEKDILIGEDVQTDTSVKKTKEKKSKVKKEKKIKQNEQVSTDDSSVNTPRKGLMYNIAKWWVDERYKREEPHHGALHEIKIQKRMEYELRQAEAAKLKYAEINSIDNEQTEDTAQNTYSQTTESEFEIQQYEPNPELFI